MAAESSIVNIGYQGLKQSFDITSNVVQGNFEEAGKGYASHLISGAVAAATEGAVNKITYKGNYVYRALAEGDDISNGIHARDPLANNSGTSHIAGKKQSQWISTTKDKSVAFDKYDSGFGVVRIDLNKAKTGVLDYSKGIGQKGMLNNWALKDKGVLIQHYIPKSAIKRVSQ
jgi:hypothetical protein